jgi:alpha-1,2-mannosyltransferase
MTQWLGWQALLRPSVLSDLVRLRRAEWALVVSLLHLGLTSTTGFVLSSRLSAIVTPQQTFSYWTNLMSAAARTGDTISSVNQSLPAVVARLMHDRYPPTAIVALVGVCGITFAVLAARKQLDRGHDLAALVCIAFGGLLASPVSWSHHYVWAGPALIILFLEKHTIAAALGAAIFYVAPMQNIPFNHGVELTYGPWELFIAATYPLAVLLWLASRLFTRSAKASPSPDLQAEPSQSSSVSEQEDSRAHRRDGCSGHQTSLA